ncbi:MAG: DUF2911 domain-containing protein [Planctomycetes bacterium]|nr:DUF2911 domain-containing protein [Planctomycetota bacterium]MCC7171681.1 DUF2911 domain-containing protein [Planctomycetota bacterium]
MTSTRFMSWSWGGLVAVAIACSTAAWAGDDVAKPTVPGSAAALNKAFQKQDWAKVVELGPAASAEKPNDAQVWHHYGYALHMAGKLDEALVAHMKAAEFGKGQIQSLGFYNAACVHALKGDREKAFTCLGEAVATAPLPDGQLEGDADLTSLHDDPRWKDLLTRAAERAAEIELGAYSTQRMGSRILAFGARSIEVHLEWGPVAWKDEYAAAIDSGKLDGRRWRLGADFWTTLDTNVPLTFGDKTLAPGMYYVSMERRDGKTLLQFHDPVKARTQKIDPFMIQDFLSQPVEVEMTVSKSDAPTQQLTLALTSKPAKGDAPNAAITVDYGPYHAEAAMRVATK